MALFIVAVPLLPMIISGDWSWWQAWTYLLSGLAAFAVSRGLAARRHPDLLAVAGVDHFYGWSPPISLAVELAALGGLLLGYAATPLLLDSLWAFIPTLLLLVTLVVRTALEDRTLQAELAGYAEYARRTRYRLLPGVW